MNKGKKVDILFGNGSGGWNPNGKDAIQEEIAFSPSLSLFFFFFWNIHVWRRQVLLDPRNASSKMFVISNNWAIACSLRRAAGMHFSSSTVSPHAGFFVLSLTWEREGAGAMVSSPFCCWPRAVRRAASVQGGKMPRSHQLCDVLLGFPIWPLQRFLRPQLAKLNEAEVAHRVCSMRGIPRVSGYFTALCPLAMLKGW